MQTRFIQYKDNLPEMLRYATLRSEVLLANGLNGKLGMSILFYEYSRLYNDLLYKQYAEELLDAVLDSMAFRSLNIKNGLAGIAWGIVYLYRNCFLDGDFREVLSEVDEYLETNIQKAEKEILSYFVYRDDIAPDNDIYSEKEILDIIWSNWL